MFKTEVARGGAQSSGRPPLLGWDSPVLDDFMLLSPSVQCSSTECRAGSGNLLPVCCVGYAVWYAKENILRARTTGPGAWAAYSHAAYVVIDVNNWNFCSN